MGSYIEIFAVFLSGFALGIIIFILIGEIRGYEVGNGKSSKTQNLVETEMEEPVSLLGNHPAENGLTSRQTYLEGKLGLSQIAAPAVTNDSLASLREKIHKLKTRNYLD
jgi:hypothetical protein